MTAFIPQRVLSIIFFFTVLTSCNTTAGHIQGYPKKTLTLESGEKLTIWVADTDARQKKGVSGIKPEDFPKDHGMLFPFDTMYPRQFWMPNTHMNLDIIFMNADYYIIDIHRNVPMFPHEGPKNKIPLTKTVFSQHVLELRSDAPAAAKIEPGMTLKID